MKTSVTRRGHGPALIRVPAAPPTAGFGWIGKATLIALGILFALIVTHPAFA